MEESKYLLSVNRQLEEIIVRQERQLEEIISQKQKEIDDLKKHYVDQIQNLTEKVEYYKNNPIRNFTFQSFLKMMKTEYSLKTMPETSGIYVYINKKQELIYVGQSRNMKRRLRQHFRNGKVKLNGHDSEFKDVNEWSFYVAEYINKNDKKLLNERESFWIALAKHSTLNKKVTIVENFKKFETTLRSNPTKITKDLKIYDIIEEDGKVANKTNGNR